MGSMNRSRTHPIWGVTVIRVKELKERSGFLLPLKTESAQPFLYLGAGQVIYITEDIIQQSEEDMSGFGTSIAQVFSSKSVNI